MIAFLTFLLGLVSGVHRIDVAVDPRVTKVEFVLDGRVVGAVEKPPWRLPVDFGEAMVPHDLQVVAYDASGERVGTARQAINLPGESSQVGLVLERNEDGVPTAARVNWESIYAGEPTVSANFDGEPLPLTSPTRIELPPHTLENTHFLRVEVSFANSVTAAAEVAYGGALADEASSELTAVPIELPKGSELPPLAQLQGWLELGGQPLEIVAAEKGKAEVVIVRDQGVKTQMERIYRKSRDLLRVGMGNNTGRQLRLSMPLENDQLAYLMLPFPYKAPRLKNRYQVFPLVGEFSSRDVGMYWLLANIDVELARGPEQQIAEAVAIAGISSTASHRRRAVVLALGREPQDKSPSPPGRVRELLAALRVPFAVWTLGPTEEPATAAWGELTDASSLAKLDAAVTALRDRLERQRILWVRGHHLPQRLELSAAARARGLVLAGSP